MRFISRLPPPHPNAPACSLLRWWGAGPVENVHILTQLQCRESASSGVARGELGRREFWRSAATSPAYPGCDVANLRQLNGAGGNGIWAFPRGRSSARDSAVQCEESLLVWTGLAS